MAWRRQRKPAREASEEEAPGEVLGQEEVAAQEEEAPVQDEAAAQEVEEEAPGRSKKVQEENAWLGERRREP